MCIRAWVSGTIDMLDLQSLHDLSHMEIIVQKAQFHISMVLLVAPHHEDTHIATAYIHMLRYRIP